MAALGFEPRSILLQGPVYIHIYSTIYPRVGSAENREDGGILELKGTDLVMDGRKTL